MASFTSSQSGLWSSASTWGGAGVPGDGDTVTIASGHTVTFDVDQSGFASGLAGLTVNGTLKFKEDVITCLKMANDVEIVLSSNGKLIIGDDNSPIQRPPQGSAYRARILFQGSGRINNANDNTQLIAVGWTPSRNHTTLASNASSGSNQIVLSDSLNLQAGDMIYIGAGSVNGPLTETGTGVYTVQSVSGDGKTVTLTQNLGHNRFAGDYVAWYSRPIYLGNSTRLIKNSHIIEVYLKGVFLNYNLSVLDWYNMLLKDYLMEFCTLNSNTEIGDNVYRGWTPLKACTLYKCALVHSGGVKVEDSVIVQTDNVDSGCVSYTAGIYFKSCVFQNLKNLWKYYYTVNGELTIENSIVKNVETVFTYPYILTLKDMELTSNLTAIRKKGLFYNVKFTNFNFRPHNIISHIESFNHNQVSDAYRAWMRGGTIQSITNEYPPCGNKSYQYTLTNSTIPVHRTLQLGILQPQQTIQISCWLKKTINNMSIQPRFQLIDNNNDPLIDPSKQPLQEAISSTSVANQWEELTIRYKNTTDKEIPISVRCLAANSTGFIYEYINLDRIFYMSNVFG